MIVTASSSSTTSSSSSPSASLLTHRLPIFGRYIRPCFRKTGLYTVLCECTPLKLLFKTIKLTLKTFLRFRWLCDWCPPFILRLRVEDTEEEKQQEEAAQAAEMGGEEKKAEEEKKQAEDEEAAQA